MKIAIKLTGVLLLVLSATYSLHAQTTESTIKTRIVADTLRNGKVNFSIACETSETFTNGGYTLEFTMKKDDRTYSISFTDVKAPKKGTRMEDAARVAISLGKLKHGIYSFEFTDVRGGKEIKWKKTLIVNKDGFTWFTPTENPQK